MICATLCRELKDMDAFNSSTLWVLQMTQDEFKPLDDMSNSRM